MKQNYEIVFEKILAGAAFTFFLLITCYKLTSAPLWFDETIEYWYSKIMFGPLPFELNGTVGTTNMYQRIVSTFQPPLYNLIMFFWLKFSSSEWWFRFFGVVMGFIGNVGIYKTVKKIGNGYLAAIAVFFSSCVYQLLYYWQECAEYCLMLGTLCWTVYFFFCILEEQSTKNIVLFTISAILPIYSQYGAVFPVVPMLITVYIFVLVKKEKKPICKITISYIVAFVTAAIPLVFFFLRKQMENQQGGEITVKKLEFGGNILVDIFKNLVAVVKWNFFSYFADRFSWIFSGAFLVIFLVVIILTKKNVLRLFGVINLITWMLYYFAVKIGFYSYGSFGSRYNLFFLPLWIILFFGFGIEIYDILRDKCSSRWSNAKYLFLGGCASLIICFMVSSWSIKFQGNREKDNMEDMRGAVDVWVKEGAQDSNTLVYYGGDSCFSYYIRRNKAYNEDMENNVKYMYWYRNKTVEKYTEYVNSIYGNEWPDEIYIVGVHMRDDFNTLVSVFTDHGYTREDLYNSNGLLVRVTNSNVD